VSRYREAFVTLTVAGTVVYTDVRCSGCGRVVMAWPGAVVVAVYAREQMRVGHGVGPTVLCRRCGTLNEVEVAR